MYADDVILFASPTIPKAHTVARVLSIFGSASGLLTNLSKCSITPIYGADEALPGIQAMLPCRIAQFPITYLGVPLSTHALPKSCWRPVVDKVAAKLPLWQGPLMQKSGRLILTKSVLSAMPIYWIMADQMPAWALEEIDGIRRQFFWAGKDVSIRGKCLVAWETVCLPTENGGLGVTNFKLSGIALGTRWLWLQRTDPERAWTALPIKVSPEVQAFFDASITIQIGNGERTLFWTDKWIDGESICDLVPTLVARVGTRTKKSRTVAQALTQDRWVRDITGGLSVLAVVEYLHLWPVITAVHLTPGVEDAMRWRWTSSGQFSASSAYKALQLGRTTFYGAQCIWKSWAPLQVKLFFWLATRGRIWTADRRKRRGLDAHDKCFLCDQVDETANHLIVSCPVAREVWWRVLSWAKCSCTFLAGEAGIQEWWEHLLSIQPHQRRKGVSTLFMITGWQLWKERNARLFDRTASSTSVVVSRIQQEADLWIAAGARKLGSLFCE
ncbi:unnamed protein product [Urochloa decumbens]|uniref:Reverse transcriptase domain-containing protein n=1 Tax=Urochloa decumbens TaxID=240449 RepID=A0ABC8YV61_9POAL